MQDNLINIRKLPASLLSQLDKLIVNRIGEGPDANMITRDITGFIEPGHTYRFIADPSAGVSLQSVASHTTPFSIPPIQKEPVIPNHVIMTGEWQEQACIIANDANILGGMGLLLLEPNQQQTIPIIEATADDLAFYNAHLIKSQECLSLETTQALPITHVYIGENYVPGYLSEENHGGGDYIEYHDQPHFWAPRSPDASGHILLSRKYQNKFFLTGFQIPFGTGIYLSPYTRHSDAYLVGDYLVVYTVTDNYSTVLFRDKDWGRVRLAFAE